MSKFNRFSKFIGVKKGSGTKLLYAKIVINKIEHCFFGFKTEYEAALKYDSFCIENKLNRRLNFPEPEPENLIPNTKLIRLTKGMFAIVDNEDFERVNKFNWSAHKYGENYYASTEVNTKHLTMHCLIMGRKWIDHQNHNGLHNYKSNLRPCTPQQNQMNKLPKANSSSKYKGVCFSKNNNKYRVLIGFNYKRIHLGYFKNEIEAAKAYDQHAKELFGEFAYLNFPD